MCAIRLPLKITSFAGHTPSLQGSSAKFMSSKAMSIQVFYLLKSFVFQVLNVCHSLLDTLKKHAVWSTKPTQFRHCTWPNFGQMVSITCHLCKGRLNRQNPICNWPAASTCHGELKYC